MIRHLIAPENGTSNKRWINEQKVGTTGKILQRV
jgi:hypothetical protein